MAYDFDRVMQTALDAIINFGGKSAHAGPLAEHEAMCYLELCQLTEVWAKYNKLVFEINIQKMIETQHKENEKHQKWREKNKPDEPIG